MNKQITFKINAILCICILSSFLYCLNIRTLPLIPNNKNFNQFYLNGELINEKNTVYHLQQILLKYDTNIKFLYKPFPLNEENYQYRIDYYIEGNPRHIMIGNKTFVYSDSKGHFYHIENE